ncbi:hypothetical protein GE21DRAFT_1062358 [Neurospora crassa]|nr:hypothetical protein GE21DRAFT_1062358 [Neurospora crassa]
MPTDRPTDLLELKPYRKKKKEKKKKKKRTRKKKETARSIYDRPYSVYERLHKKRNKSKEPSGRHKSQLPANDDQKSNTVEKKVVH